MPKSHFGLANLTIRYVKAYEQFTQHPDSIMSGNTTREFGNISQRFFRLRDELLEEGLKIGTGRRYGLSSLEVVVFRWAVWQQAASHTTTLASWGGMSTHDDAQTIMTMLGRAEGMLIDTINEEWADIKDLVDDEQD